MKYWFTADCHFDDVDIISCFNRPFKSLQHMNKTLVANWNSRVEPEDIVIHNGDFIQKIPGGTKSKDWESQLNGKIIHISGNHDNNNGCKTIIKNMTIIMGGKRIFITHNPEHVGFVNGHDLAFTAHVHTNWKIKRVKRMFDFIDCINVGVDVWKFRPVSFNEIMKRYFKWLKLQGDK